MPVRGKSNAGRKEVIAMGRHSSTQYDATIIRIAAQLDIDLWGIVSECDERGIRLKKKGNDAMMGATSFA